MFRGLCIESFDEELVFGHLLLNSFVQEGYLMLKTLDGLQQEAQEDFHLSLVWQKLQDGVAFITGDAQPSNLRSGGL